MVIVNYKTLYECMMQSKAFGICYVWCSCLWVTWHDRCDDVRVLCGCAGKLDVIDVISCSCLGRLYCFKNWVHRLGFAVLPFGRFVL